MITTLTQVFLLFAVILLCISNSVQLYMAIKDYKRNKQFEKELEKIQKSMIEILVDKQVEMMKEDNQSEQPSEDASEK